MIDELLFERIKRRVGLGRIEVDLVYVRTARKRSVQPIILHPHAHRETNIQRDNIKTTTKAHASSLHCAAKELPRLK